MTHLRNTIVGAESSGVTAVGAEPVTRLKDTILISYGSTPHMLTDLPADKDRVCSGSGRVPVRCHHHGE